MNQFKTRVLASSMLTAAALAAGGAANAQVDVVTVTATKVESTTQEIPIAVSALGEQTLEELDVDVFTDYLVQLPGVTAGGSGPGQNTIYIRGVASTTPNLTTAGVAGLAPNVAFYLVTYAVERAAVTGDLTPEADGFDAQFRPLDDLRAAPDRIRDSDLERIEMAFGE